MAFKSLSQPRVRLADEVYAQILQAIQNGAITSEDRIVQEKLAEEFGISRTPVREALFRMEQEGILAVAQRGGFKIRKIGPDEITELYEARCSIEGFAARLLAQRNDKALNMRLREIIADAEDLKNETVKAYFNANLTVHRAIVEASENRFLLEFFDNLWNRGSSFTLFSTIESTDLSKSLGDHMALIDAIESGNDTFAAEKMIAHISDGHRLQVQSGRV
ncbi:GntR family transcriptional regulator [Phaeobacter marinintestinus]|uniref:GntR family transcriptional regulator n=1 Tax=Falsiphaeobacter marinintestinus TaxID=1492905 RepID=UPI001644C325|nr:GntR family transcriptional regulator [Phaeobacter marinintestinus]